MQQLLTFCLSFFWPIFISLYAEFPIHSFFQYWGLNSGPHLLGKCSTTWGTPTVLFCVRYFPDRVLWTVSLGWLATKILVISASWVTRTTCVSHLLSASFFKKVFETRFHYVAESGLELEVLLPQPPECWGYRNAPSLLASCYNLWCFCVLPFLFSLLH
jgi:hypothetical protein